MASFAAIISGDKSAHGRVNSGSFDKLRSRGNSQEELSPLRCALSSLNIFHTFGVL